MVSRNVALPAVIALALLGSFLVAPPSGPTAEYVVRAEQPSEASSLSESFDVPDPMPYENLSADYQRVVDAALANDGTKRYDGETYPASVQFPDENGRLVRAVEHRGETLVVQFTKNAGTVTPRTVVSIVAGFGLLVYAGYRYSQPEP